MKGILNILLLLIGFEVIGQSFDISEINSTKFTQDVISSNSPKRNISKSLRFNLYNSYETDNKYFTGGNHVFEIYNHHFGVYLGYAHFSFDNKTNYNNFQVAASYFTPFNFSLWNYSGLYNAKVVEPIGSVTTESAYKMTGLVLRYEKSRIRPGIGIQYLKMADSSQIKYPLFLNLFEQHQLNIKLSWTVSQIENVLRYNKPLMHYVEGELEWKVLNQLSITLLLGKGDATQHYSFQEGGYLILNTAALTATYALKLTANIHRNLNLFGKIGTLEFKTFSSTSYSMGLVWKMKKY